MKNSTLSVDFDGRNISRDEFLESFKTKIRVFIQGEWNLDYILREIVKNFHDHARDKRGHITINFTGRKISFEAYDFGPGHPDPSVCTIEDAVEHVKKFGSSKYCYGINAGLGLFTLTGALDGLKIHHPDATWSASVQGKFYYQGSYTSNVIQDH